MAMVFLAITVMVLLILFFETSLHQGHLKGGVAFVAAIMVAILCGCASVLLAIGLISIHVVL